MKNLFILSAFVLASFNQLVAQEKNAVGETPLRIIAFGAHPDDAELKAGGMAALWAAQGHKVKFLRILPPPKEIQSFFIILIIF